MKINFKNSFFSCVGPLLSAASLFQLSSSYLNHLGFCSYLHSLALTDSGQAHVTLISLCVCVPLPLASSTILSFLPSAFHSFPSDPSRCSQPLYAPSFVGPHLLYCPPRALLWSDHPQITTRSWASQISTELHGSLRANLAGRAAAAQFAHLRQSMKIILKDYNTSKRLRTHVHTHTHKQASVLLIAGY